MLRSAIRERRNADRTRGARGGQRAPRRPASRCLEPDECYSSGPFLGRPDVAIEVEIGAPLVDKLAVYAGLGIREVWVWQRTRLVMYVLSDDGYATAERSAVLPDLDVVLLCTFVELGESQTRNVKAYRAALRSR